VSRHGLHFAHKFACTCLICGLGYQVLHTHIRLHTPILEERPTQTGTYIYIYIFFCVSKYVCKHNHTPNTHTHTCTPTLLHSATHTHTCLILPCCMPCRPVVWLCLQSEVAELTEPGRREDCRIAACAHTTDQGTTQLSGSRRCCTL